MNKKWLVGLPMAALCLAALYMVIGPEPTLSLDVANGTYANDCCVPVSLRNGVMSFDDHEIAYLIESDKQGAYVLPRAYVGVESGLGLQIERNRNRLKLRLDDGRHPKTITIFGSDRAEYQFKR